METKIRIPEKAVMIYHGNRAIGTEGQVGVGSSGTLAPPRLVRPLSRL